jgi:hypothetical protein
MCFTIIKSKGCVLFNLVHGALYEVLDEIFVDHGDCDKWEPSSIYTRAPPRPPIATRQRRVVAFYREACRTSFFTIVMDKAINLSNLKEFKGECTGTYQKKLERILALRTQRDGNHIEYNTNVNTLQHYQQRSIELYLELVANIARADELRSDPRSKELIERCLATDSEHDALLKELDEYITHMRNTYGDLIQLNESGELPITAFRFDVERDLAMISPPKPVVAATQRQGAKRKKQETTSTRKRAKKEEPIPPVESTVLDLGDISLSAFDDLDLPIFSQTDNSLPRMNSPRQSEGLFGSRKL